MRGMGGSVIHIWPEQLISLNVPISMLELKELVALGNRETSVVKVLFWIGHFVVFLSCMHTMVILILFKYKQVNLVTTWGKTIIIHKRVFSVLHFPVRQKPFLVKKSFFVLTYFTINLFLCTVLNWALNVAENKKSTESLKNICNKRIRELKIHLSCDGWTI